MTVVILSMAALLVVGVIAMFASRWEKKGPSEEDPDLRTDAERRSVAAATTALAASRAKQARDHHH